LEAVCSMDSQRSTRTACRHRKPRWTVAAGADENDQVWLTAVGRGAIWPIEVSGSQRFEYHSHLGSPPREFALLIAALGLFGTYACIAYWMNALGLSTTPLTALRTVTWLGEQHRGRKKAGFPAVGFFLGLFLTGLYPLLFLTGLYPLALWELRWTWS